MYCIRHHVRIRYNLNYIYFGFVRTSLMADNMDFSVKSTLSTIFPMPLRSANLMFMC